MEKITDHFYPLLTKLSKQNKKAITRNLLSIDPGETTGWVQFTDGKLVDTGMLETKKLGLGLLDIFNIKNPNVIDFDYVVIEDYKIYPHMLKQHSLSAVFPVKVIGVLQYIFELKKIPVVLQMASTGKSFCTDKRLKEWGYWIKGQKHSRDAIRHGAHWLLFGRR